MKIVMGVVRALRAALVAAEPNYDDCWCCVLGMIGPICPGCERRRVKEPAYRPGLHGYLTR